MGKIRTMILKYIGFGLMFMFVCFVGVCVLFYFVAKRILGPVEKLEPETNDWGEIEDRQPNTL